MENARIKQFESKMQKRLFCWLFNLVLMLVVFANAELGHLLGIPGQSLAISVVWPATGFSLAAMLLFGYRSWPGVFLGNFLYNSLNLYLNGTSVVGPIIAAILISSGSLAQAFLSTYIIRRYASEEYFNTVKDILIFLVPASLLACVVASTVGVVTLYFYGALSLQLIPYLWLVFWLGDTMGVYIFTPLLVVWTLSNPILKAVKYLWEILIVLAVFFILTAFTFILKFPVGQLFLPLSLWVTYRFRMHGATMAILFISITAIFLTSIGFGFPTHIYPGPLGVLVSFLEIIVATSLLLAAVINEREDAWYLIQSQNQDLQATVAMREEALKEMQGALFIKKKLIDSLGLLTSGITKQLQEPVKHINDFVRASNICLTHLRQVALSKKGRGESDSILMDNLKTLDGYLHNITKFELYTDRVVKAILEQSQLVSPSNIEVKPINLNTMLKNCLLKCLEKESEVHPNFNFEKRTQFSETMDDVLALPESLTYAFMRLIDHAIHFLKIKKDKLRASFAPKLEIRTINHPDNIEIVIKENAGSHSFYHHLFGSFIDQGTVADVPKITPLFSEQPEESYDLGLALAHDILVHVHHGKIIVNFKEEEFIEIIILFPKSMKS